MPELMGAYGCALHAAADYNHRTSLEGSTLLISRSIDDLQNLAHYETKQLQCKGCENHCYVSRYTFAGGTGSTPETSVSVCSITREQTGQKAKIFTNTNIVYSLTERQLTHLTL